MSIADEINNHINSGDRVINKDDRPGYVVGALKGQVLVLHDDNNIHIYTNKDHLRRFEDVKHNNY